MVRHPDLRDGPAGDLELDQELGREEGAARLDREAFERLPPEELAGTVDVADPEPEEDPVRQPIEPGIDRPDEGIRPFDPVADDDVGAIRLGEPYDEPAAIVHPGLAHVLRGWRQVGCGPTDSH